VWTDAAVEVVDRSNLPRGYAAASPATAAARGDDLRDSAAVAEILVGRDAGWSAQRRDDGTLSRGELVRHYVVPTVLGLGLAAGAYAVSTPLLLWMSPVVAGLILAMPVAALTSRPSVGRALRQRGLLLTPEESAPPAVLLRANALAAEGPDFDASDPIGMLERRANLLETHLDMLGGPAPRRRGEVDADLVIALAKIEDASDRREAAAMLSTREIFALLTSRAALQLLFAKPAEPPRTPPKLLPELVAHE
jgi:membrane glycosyltransferase